MGLNIYQAAKNSTFIIFPVIRTLITFLQKRNEYIRLIDTIFDYSISEIDKMQSKDIAKIKVTDGILILKSVFIY
jgi:hypothetical protein